AVLWNLRPVAPVRWLAWLMMLFAFTFFAASLSNPNPGTIGAPTSTRSPRGVIKITRHPGFVAFSLFGFAHMLTNGFVGDLIFFATFPAVSIIGGRHQDHRKLADIGESYRSLVE